MTVISGSTDESTKEALDEIVEEYDEFTSRSGLVGKIADLVVEAETRDDTRDPVSLLEDALDNETRQTAVNEYQAGIEDDVVLTADQLAEADLDNREIDPGDVDWDSFHSGHSTELKADVMTAVIRREYGVIKIPEDRDKLQAEVMRHLGIGEQYARQYVDEILDRFVEVDTAGSEAARYVTREEMVGNVSDNDGGGEKVEKKQAVKALEAVKSGPENIDDYSDSTVDVKLYRIRTKIEDGFEAGLWDEYGMTDQAEAALDVIDDLEEADHYNLGPPPYGFERRIQRESLREHMPDYWEIPDQLREENDPEPGGGFAIDGLE